MKSLRAAKQVAKGLVFTVILGCLLCLYYNSQDSVNRNAQAWHVPAAALHLVSFAFFVVHVLVSGSDSFQNRPEAFKFIVRFWTMVPSFLVISRVHSGLGYWVLIMLGVSVAGVLWLKIRDILKRKPVA